MITALEERKTKLLIQIEMLNREIDISKLLEQNDLASCCGMDSVRYPNLDKLWENSKI